MNIKRLNLWERLKWSTPSCGRWAACPLRCVSSLLLVSASWFTFNFPMTHFNTFSPTCLMPMQSTRLFPNRVCKTLSVDAMRRPHGTPIKNCLLHFLLSAAFVRSIFAGRAGTEHRDAQLHKGHVSSSWIWAKKKQWDKPDERTINL